jgi:hypothetical protein
MFVLFSTKMGWATYWANFSRIRPFTLIHSYMILGLPVCNLMKNMTYPQRFCDRIFNECYGILPYLGKH